MSTAGSSADRLPAALRMPSDTRPGTLPLVDLLLAAVDEQRGQLAADIDTIWDDYFIDSCADWAVPYLAALVGLGLDASRREVADAVGLRRRKGTPGALADFALVLSGWTARVIEGWQVTAWAQRMGRALPLRPAAVRLRSNRTDQLGTPYERVARSVTPSGRWSPKTVTVAVWPWEVGTYRRTQAVPLLPPSGIDIGPPRLALHPLAAEAPLFVRPALQVPQRDIAPAAVPRYGDERDAPVQASYRTLAALAGEDDVVEGPALAFSASYPLASAPGAEPPLISLELADGPILWTALRFTSLPAAAPPAQLPQPDEALVDPLRGQVALGETLANRPGPLLATWHRPFAGRLGALASDADANPAARVVVTVDPDREVAGQNVSTLDEAFRLAEELAAAVDTAGSAAGPDVEIRLETSRQLAAPASAATAFRPRLPRWRLVAPRLFTPTIVGSLSLDLEGGEVEIAGAVLAGDLVVGPGLSGLRLDHITMNPPAGTAISVDPGSWALRFEAAACLLAGIRCGLLAEPLRLRDCVVDGRGARLRVCGGDASDVGSPSVATPGRFAPALDARGVTFSGPASLGQLNALNCIFADGLDVAQRDAGCVMHSYLGATQSQGTPAGYQCGPFPAPVFASVGFEGLGYYALRLEAGHPLLAGADDGGEVGAYHTTARSARVTRLRQRVAEFTPIGLNARIELAPEEET